MDTYSNKKVETTTWLVDLFASKAEIECGEQVPMQPTLDRMKAAIKRIEVRQVGADQRKV
jgi:hypothetical protein